MDPTLAGFIAFIQNVMGISATYLPTNSPVIAIAFNVAMTLTNSDLQLVPNYDPTQNSIYALAVYNLGGDRVVNFAPDQAGQNYFANLRASLNVAGFVSGVISSSSDEGTSQSLITPEAMKNLTFRDLQTLKTPWGRTYMGLAQAYGPAIWGLS